MLRASSPLRLILFSATAVVGRDAVEDLVPGRANERGMVRAPCGAPPATMPQEFAARPESNQEQLSCPVPSRSLNPQTFS